jgi:serine/threonine protein kinase
MTRDDRLTELVARWDELRKKGDEPSLASLCAEDPDVLDALKREISKLSRAYQVLDLAAKEEDAMLGWTPGNDSVAGYRLVRKIGEGGFGEVWEARQRDGDLPVALKGVDQRGAAGVFEREALKIVSQYKRHVNLIAISRAWEQSGILIIEMELADRSLHDRLMEAKGQGLTGIPGEELLKYMREAAQAIDHLNSPIHTIANKENLWLAHLDIKPRNLLLLGGCVKVADFGLVRESEHSLTGFSGAGTFEYAAIEILRGQRAVQSDQYSLAITYCELRAGRRPFQGLDRSSRDLDMLPVRERPAVERALSPDPKMRWANCTQFVEEIGKALPDHDQSPHPSTLPPRQPSERGQLRPSTTRTWRGHSGIDALPPGSRPRRRFRIAAVLAVELLLAALAAGAGAYLARDAPSASQQLFAGEWIGLGTVLFLHSAYCLRRGTTP